ncbi:MAG: hypothetical protein RLZZ366_636 [Pseudomonadota bacterium]|jgi:Protein of unknown function (DUF4230)
MKQIWFILLSMLLLTISLFAYVQHKADPPAETIVASSLKSLHEQNRLSAFAARFVTVVTSSKDRFGLHAEKTLIIPAVMRYEIDLAMLKQSDLNWDSGTKTLTVHLPPVELAGPEFDLGGVKEYESGAVLLTLTDVEALLDTANRAKAKADVLAQAKAAPMLRLARDASGRALSSSFSLPLAAAGIAATVKVNVRE